MQYFYAFIILRLRAGTHYSLARTGSAGKSNIQGIFDIKLINQEQSRVRTLKIREWWHNFNTSKYWKKSSLLKFRTFSGRIIREERIREK